jgi:hypothetical protein
MPELYNSTAVRSLLLAEYKRQVREVPQNTNKTKQNTIRFLSRFVLFFFLNARTPIIYRDRLGTDRIG